MDRAVAAPASPVRRFLIQAALWNLGLFAFLRFSWVDQHLVSALIAFQQRLVAWYGSAAPVGLSVTSSCSGADVIALCLGMTLAYPTAWSKRLAGAVGGVVLILTLNVVRLASLYAVATSPSTLNLLHLYVWPVLLVFATLTYAFLWIRWSDRPAIGVSRTWVRLLVASGVALLVYAATVPWVLTSSLVHGVAVGTAESARAVLSITGTSVHAQGSVLLTQRGGFEVTQECLFTPVLPLYFAAVFALPLARRTRWVWLALALPLFFLLGVARLLVLAVPPVIVDAPLFVAHGFYQLVAAFVLISAAGYLSLRRARVSQVVARIALALTGGLAAGLLAGPAWSHVVEFLLKAAHQLVPSAIDTLRPAADTQGALAMQPIYQLGLTAGLWLASSGGRQAVRFATAILILLVSQVAFLVLVGMVASRLQVTPHALVMRAWGIIVPVLLSFAFVSIDGTRVGDRRYRRFWQDVGDNFPELTGASSTTLYRNNEEWLISQSLPDLRGISLLKTDLWDEAKNTRILQWAADQGARTYGIDLSEPIVRQARAAFGDRALHTAVSDVRRIPFADNSFDAIYSMGTVEHFAETSAAVAELARLLKPGGRLILGVPNRHDPFLRPLFVAALSAVGLYGYGFEKSYSRRALRGMLEHAGLVVERESGILFVPGWLRMLDLWCYTRARGLTVITRALLQPFLWIDRRTDAFRRHGYLLASVGVKKDDGRDRGAATKPPPVVDLGVEYVVDAKGCDPDKLRSLPALQRLFDDLLGDLSLVPAAAPVWHVFPEPAGITGLVLLTESHLTIHTYPDERVATINLYCCRPRATWPWDQRLRAHLGARDVQVRTLRRG